MIYLHIYLWHFSFISMVLSLSVFNTRKYSCSISFNHGHIQLRSPNCVFLKICFVFICEWYFHRVLNSRSAFQRCQSIVCWLLLFLWGVFLWSQYAFFFWFLLFSGCLYNFLLCLCFWQFYYDISVSVFFFSLPFGLLLVIFLLHAWLFLHKIQKLCVKHCMTV